MAWMVSLRPTNVVLEDRRLRVLTPQHLDSPLLPSTLIFVSWFDLIQILLYIVDTDVYVTLDFTLNSTLLSRISEPFYSL